MRYFGLAAAAALVCLATPLMAQATKAPPEESCSGRGWVFIEEIGDERAKKLLPGKGSCRASFKPTYWVCSTTNRFKVRCMTAEDLAEVKKE
jgi:hypothetical protein